MLPIAKQLIISGWWRGTLSVIYTWSSKIGGGTKVVVVLVAVSW